jgi:hypothetical protein
MTDNRLADAVATATTAFYAALAEAYPEAKSGDTDPVMDARFDRVAEEAIIDWLTLNFPGGPRAAHDSPELDASVARHPAGKRLAGPCSCACNSGGFCGGCGHAGCGGRR